MVGQIGEYFACTSAGTEELIGMQREFISGKHGMQTAFVEWTIVGYNRQIVYLGLDLVPYFGEEALGVGIVPSDTVYHRVEIVVKIRVGFYQSVIGTRNLSIIDKDESYAAHTAGVSVGGFEI